MNGPVHHQERRPVRAAFVIGAGLILIGLVMVWDAAGLRQGGGYSGVGPAAVPRMVGGGLIVLGLWTGISGWRGQFAPAPRQDFGPVLWILAGLLLQLVTLHWAGFTVACGLLFGLTARGFGQRNLPLAIGVGLVFAFVIYGIFDRLLRLNLPAGPLEMLIYGG